MTYSVHEAKTQFSKLLDLVEQGEEVVIVRHGQPVARLVASHPGTKRVLGSMRGKITGLKAGKNRSPIRRPTSSWTAADDGTLLARYQHDHLGPGQSGTAFQRGAGSHRVRDSCCKRCLVLGGNDHRRWPSA